MKTGQRYCVLVVLLAQMAVYLTGNYIYDPIAGIIVGLILGFLAIILIKKITGTSLVNH